MKRPLPLISAGVLAVAWLCTGSPASAQGSGCSGIPTNGGGNLCVLGNGTPVWNQSAGTATAPAIHVAGDVFVDGDVTSSGGTHASGQIGLEGPDAPMNWTPPPVPGQPEQPDPLAGATFDGDCANPQSAPASGTITPGTYSGLDVNSGQTLTLDPGVYTLTGDLANSGGTITGTGVTIYFCGTAMLDLSSNNNGTTTLSAPGGASGMLLFFDRANTGDALSLQNNNGGVHADLTGTIYAPEARMYSSGGSNSSTYNMTGDVIVGRIYWSGAHTLNIGASSAPPPVPSGQTLRNCATIMTTTDETTTADNTDCNEASILQEVPLTNVAITKTGPAEVLSGQTVTYHLVAANTSDVDAEDVAVTDQLPAELTGITVTPSDVCTVDASNLLTCNLGTLPANSTAPIEVTGTFTGTGMLARPFHFRQELRVHPYQHAGNGALPVVHPGAYSAASPAAEAPAAGQAQAPVPAEDGDTGNGLDYRPLAAGPGA